MGQREVGSLRTLTRTKAVRPWIFLRRGRQQSFLGTSSANDVSLLLVHCNCLPACFRGRLEMACQLENRTMRHKSVSMDVEHVGLGDAKQRFSDEFCRLLEIASRAIRRALTDLQRTCPSASSLATSLCARSAHSSASASRFIARSDSARLHATTARTHRSPIVINASHPSRAIRSAASRSPANISMRDCAKAEVAIERVISSSSNRSRHRSASTRASSKLPDIAKRPALLSMSQGWSENDSRLLLTQRKASSIGAGPYRYPAPVFFKASLSTTRSWRARACIVACSPATTHAAK